MAPVSGKIKMMTLLEISKKMSGLIKKNAKIRYVKKLKTIPLPTEIIQKPIIKPLRRFAEP